MNHLPSRPQPKMQHTLYPTWFRWTWVRRFRMGQLRYFISHMVQMNPIYAHMDAITPSALYPTWFRWTKFRGVGRGGSEELYIPHGSDEPLTFWFCQLHLNYFISHMVQMNLIPLAHLSKVPVNFISHMVQMNPIWQTWYVNMPAALYPTWFRWTSFHKISCPLDFVLYIPHGSDEPKGVEHERHERSDFISHMVQMNLIFLLSITELQNSLYPTWFRWTQSLLGRLNKNKRPLYPTWFRWTDYRIFVFWNFKKSLYPTWFRWTSPTTTLT